ncbi:MAG TPA: branched-chain amino acid ABC transporter permease [Anaerolineales bacterium]|nr:branched-chain amino acid ABC transporter permease [Anaerolineales bacterium]
MKKKSSILKWILIGAVACLLLAFPAFAKSSYQVHIVNNIGIWLLLSLGLNIAMGYGGQFNLALGALWGVGAYTAALLQTRLGVPFWINLPLGIIAAATMAALVGLPSFKVRSHYLAIVTIGLGEVINLFLVNQDELTGGALGINRIKPPSLFGFPIDTNERFYYLILIMVILGYLIGRQIVGHRIGRAFRALRDDFQAARAMGVNTGFYQILAFAISGAYAGAAGVLFAHWNSYISPDIFEFKSALIVLTMIMIGGMGSLPGSVVGTVLLLVLNEYLRVFERWQLVGYGVAIIVVVLFLPGGVVELVRRFGSLRQRWSAGLTKEKSNVEEERNVP